MSDLGAALGIFGGAIILVGLLSIIISIAVYVIASLSHMKALKALGYDKAWMAWIPFANFYAYAESVTEGEETVNLFDKFDIPVMVYRLWWIAPIILIFLPIPLIKGLLSAAIQVIFLGNTYCKMYATLENKTEQEVQLVGYFSGAIPLIAICKFLFGKYE